jgi:UDP-3-O-[3-hydroxymyristoyl] glucosamine N-acyltransferase
MKFTAAQIAEILDGESLQGSPSFGYNEYSRSYVHFKILPKIVT